MVPEPAGRHRALRVSVAALLGCGAAGFWRVGFQEAGSVSPVSPVYVIGTWLPQSYLVSLMISNIQLDYHKQSSELSASSLLMSELLESKSCRTWLLYSYSQESWICNLVFPHLNDSVYFSLSCELAWEMLS